MDHKTIKGKYILDESGEAKEITDIVEWAKWIQTGNRRIAEDEVGNYTVSTVFLGLDFSFGKDSGPLLFETMVFVGELDTAKYMGAINVVDAVKVVSKDGYFKRYGTRKEAEEGHKKIVESVKEDLTKSK